jgi:ABC-type nitrate/sulfonate/bicarbonate transport system substrate-binding protein
MTLILWCPSATTKQTAKDAKGGRGMTRRQRTNRTVVRVSAAVAFFAVTLGSLGAAHALDKLHIATASTSLAHGPLGLAVADPSIFAGQNIAIDITDLRGNSANCIAALLSKAADLCQVGTPTGVDAIAEGAKLKAVAVLTGPINELFISSKAAAATGVSPTAPVEQRIKALKGMRLVTSAPGTAHYLTLMGTLKKVGLSMSDISFRTLGDVPAMIESIRNGQIDGALWTIGSLGPLLKDNSGVRWISMARGDIDEFKTLPYVTVYARTDWVEANPDLVKRLHAGYAEAIRRLKSDPEKSSALFKAKFFPDLDQALWDDGYAQVRAAYLDGAKTTAKSWQQSLDMQKVGTGKDYKDAAFEMVVIPDARAD